MTVLLTIINNNQTSVLQALMEKCSDFLEFQEEHPVEPDAAEKLLFDHPKGYDLSLKRVYGI